MWIFLQLSVHAGIFFHHVNTEMLSAWQADFRNELETPMELEQKVQNCFITYYL